MKKDSLLAAPKNTRANRGRKRWSIQRAALSCVVVLCMVYSMILPAIALEKTEPGTPGHTHTQECYAQVTAVEKRILVCDPEIPVIHHHDGFCYDENGSLQCPLSEVEIHQHTDSCYAQPEVHAHTAQCSTRERGELICIEHVHTEQCDQSVSELICGQEKSEEHPHDESCYEMCNERICGIESDHQHADSCYVWEEVLTCTLPTDTEGEPVRICEQEEILPHLHLADCYDGEGNLICDKPERQEHQHTEACFETVEEPVDTQALTCALPDDENHTHSALCYGTWERICGLEEESKPQEETTIPSETESNVPLTDDRMLVRGLSAEPLSKNTSLNTVFARVGENVVYRVSVQTDTFAEEAFAQGRVRLEFVLPLTAQEADFDLNAMSWLDQTEGYAPVITEETRILEETAIPCRVLTGYKLLMAEGEESAIPGEFSENLVIQVKQMEAGKTAAPQVSAAMECNTWEGACEIHGIPEKMTEMMEPFTAACSAEDAQANYDLFLEEVEMLEEGADGDGEGLLERLTGAYRIGALTEESYRELYDRAFIRLYGRAEAIAEQAIGNNWMALRDSGWFEAYAGCTYSPTQSVSEPSPLYEAAPMRLSRAAAAPSEVQINHRGGTNSGDGVSVSKTIQGTQLENVFDITLQVQTAMDISEIISEPDIAVVIVMDISNTMKSDFGATNSDTSTRYAAAMNAAQMFLETFGASNSLGVSKVGFVAFNTNAHEIFDLQSCTTQDQADALTGIMRKGTGDIINNYATDSNGDVIDVARFTNIEAGLAMASDMLGSVSSKNKYIIFLSDGFPTTYIENGYDGYNPYNDATTNYGTTRFYDHVLNKKCLYGTSYSDTAAIRAREKATAIKNAGTTIFSIGVDIGGQTIQKYITQSENAVGFSVLDRTGETYEIGDATSAESYKNWLRNSIGSEHYYDSTDSEGLSNAFDQIFATIKEQVIAGSNAEWVAADPMPAETPVEFIGFYNQTPELVGGALTGSFSPGGENTVSYDSSQKSIRWDLKQSGYQSDTQGNTTTYTYQLVYRVRLCNEQTNFREADTSGSIIYPTNGDTQLNYRILEEVNGEMTVSDPKTLAFPIPSVHGFLSELTFQKVDGNDQPLAGAEFTLIHDDDCDICRGDGTAVTIASVTAASDEEGMVTFTDIPSGHRYSLVETKVPEGYSTMGITHGVEVAYDVITVTVADPADSEAQWNGRIVNFFYYALPNTGGAGIVPYTLGGFTLMTAATLLLLDDRGRRRKEDAQVP